MIPRTVTIVRTASQYPHNPPFPPSTPYPEFPSLEPGSTPNPVFDAVRESLHLAGLDLKAFGTSAWNPLGAWIRPGHTVLLKPNFVHATHPRDLQGWEYTVTHGSVIRAVSEYVYLALQGQGSIVVGDAPQTDSSFMDVCAITGTDKVAAMFKERGLDYLLTDFRKESWTAANGVIIKRERLPGDPRGYVAFDLGEQSWFQNHRGEGRYYGADYDTAEVNRHHTQGKHEYLLSGTAINCDVFVNLPKMKTHKKTGVTLNLKNLVGINGDKNWLPHHAEGTPQDGGDQFPRRSPRALLERHAGRLARRLAVKFPRLGTTLLQRVRSAGTRVAGDSRTVIRSGNWHGNDTTWRMALDLNACLLWGTTTGQFGQVRKPALSFVDGIIGGDGNGPLDSDPVGAGVIAFGDQGADVDAACAWIMGFDPDKIPVIRNAYGGLRPMAIASGSWRDLRIISNFGPWDKQLIDILKASCLAFKPHFGWFGAIER